MQYGQTLKIMFRQHLALFSLQVAVLSLFDLVTAATEPLCVVGPGLVAADRGSRSLVQIAFVTESFGKLSLILMRAGHGVSCEVA